MKIHKNFELTKYNSYRLKAFCEEAIFPTNENDLIGFLSSRRNRSKVILGNGNNIILSKNWYDECFIIFNGCFDKIEIYEDIIAAETGATMFQVSETAFENGLSGMEVFNDIPSSVGGAVVMNAGAGEEDIKNILVKVKFLNISDLVLTELSRDELKFGYRDSIFQRNRDMIVIKAWFKLKRCDKLTIRAKMDSIKEARWAKQPRDFPNCGSVFKRPVGRFVAPMIDELGLKGFTIGGAQISLKHSGFIVNKDNATGEDILLLVKEIQTRVSYKFGITLELEQKVI